MDHIYVGMGTCGISAGAEQTLNKINEIMANNHSSVDVAITGCIGMCYAEPLVDIHQGNKRYIYGKLSSNLVPQLLDKHLQPPANQDHSILKDHLILELENDLPIGGLEYEFQHNQRRIVLKNAGKINPEKISEYEELGGYQAIKKALTMSSAAIIQEIKDSGLRGRGGGGFLTGLKWQFAANQKSPHKYVICNADEGDPGAFMDRSVLEGDPHAVLEGMAICAFAIGADHGYIYCRAEYPLAIARLKKAIIAAKERGYLGKNILNTNFSFDIKIKEGAGAFVCGEETALMASIEGERGMPKIRPPFPAEKGLWAYPTNINNVETLANIPFIINKGAAAYSIYGTEKSKGTKVFALAGKIKRGGLVEVPMGITIHDLIYKIGGGIPDNKTFKAVQMGGPSGGCIPASLAHTEIDYDSITKTGAIMGSGGLVVMDESICMVEIARFFLEFTQNESCGKCTFCRVGTLRMYEILERITKGEGIPEDIETLRTLAIQIKESSLCGLGQTAPNPVLTTLNYFLDEYKAHIEDKKCPAKYCQALVKLAINQDTCTGCTLCVKQCSVDAIHGEKKHAHSIDIDKCVLCGKCLSSCPVNAIYKY